ncbi:MAG: hypothetical protein HUJ29_02980 [Gammaproteobacteria bacterium]|nr:hypothetical protein [Gammaproteobacteria bacterium]
MNEIELELITKSLLEGSPFKEWPSGMPASIDPELVLIGVSPGNSPAETNVEEISNKVEYVSAPTRIKPPNSHFYYPDGKDYWVKLRYLAHQYFRLYDECISENETISRCTHFNLGTGDAGAATKKDVEKEVVEWVSGLLNEIHKPDLVVLFGLKNIIKDDDISAWWNHKKGLKVNWKEPHASLDFEGYTKRNYQFREWVINSGIKKNIRLVIWPNHPSRSPFTNMDIWKLSVHEYLNRLKNLS